MANNNDEKPSNINVVTGKRKKMALKGEQHITDQTAYKETVKKCKAGDKGGDLSCEDWARIQVWPDKWKKGKVPAKQLGYHTIPSKIGLVPVTKKKKKKKDK